MRFLKSFLALAASVFISSAALAADHKPLNHSPLHVTPHHGQMRKTPNGVFNTTQTSNWSGYVVNAGPYSQVSGRWKVPGATWGQTNYNPYGYEYNTIWIGIGGFNDGSLIQMGTETMVSQSGAVSQYVWYELYPAVSVNIPNPVSTGDIMTADIHCTANCTPGATQSWQMTISDVTKGWTWSQNFQFASSMVSAEWIVESPWYNGWLPLNNYGQANWDSALANNVNQALTLNNALSLYDSPGGQTSNPSDIAAGNQFSTCWGFGTFTPCPIGSVGGNPPPPPPPPSAPTASLTASPSKIGTGQSATLSWKSTNASKCTGSGFNTADATTGSATVAPFGSTNYGLSCTGTGGTATASTTVLVGSCSGKHCH